MSERRFNPVTWIEGIEPLRLCVSPKPYGGEDLDEWLRQAREEGVDVLVSALHDHEQHAFGLTRQEELCAAAGIQYVNFPIIDHNVPHDIAALEELAQLLFAALTRSKGVLVHCYAGIGRSVLIASCTLAVAGIKPARAFDLIGKARGLRVPDTRAQEAFVHDFVEYINTPRETDDET
ncbi:MAG: dual specificity protein phosphatase family protein [Planctomycetes bacterium]|nr:dual specificity protein phosphatase family protein [Planctomycetota bacterium]